MHSHAGAWEREKREKLKRRENLRSLTIKQIIVKPRPNGSVNGYYS
jgi:hypothetical protein